MKKIYFTFKDNHDFRYGSTIALNLTARSIAENLKESRISGLSVPDLFIFNESKENYNINDPSLLKVNSNIDSKLIAHIANQGNYDGVVLNCNGLWYPNLSSQKFFLQDKANKLLKTKSINKLLELDFLIHLRLGDVVDPLFYKKEKYFPLNIDYYKKIVDEVGLTPTFIGQLTKSKYLDEIQKNFPESQFHDPEPIDAFLSIMTAKIKILSISSFCWFAAWCGNNNTKIYFPVAGMYDPFQFPNNFLVPFDDNRYLFEYLNKNNFSNTRIETTSRLKKLYNYCTTKYINLKYPKN
jgi:hypothetical protein